MAVTASRSEAAPAMTGDRRLARTRADAFFRSGQTAIANPIIMNPQPSHTKFTSGFTFSCRAAVLFSTS